MTKKTMTPNDLSSNEGRMYTAVNIFLSRAYDLILSWPIPESLEEETDGKTKKRTVSGCHRDGSE